MKLKHLSTAMILATLPATGVFAAALDRSGQSMSAFLQPGNYFEAGLSVLDPTVKGQEAGTSATTRKIGDIGDDYYFPSAALKLQLTDNISFGLIYDQPFGADAKYTGNNVFVSSPTDGVLNQKSLNDLSTKSVGQLVQAAGSSFGPALQQVAKDPANPTQQEILGALQRVALGGNAAVGAGLQKLQQTQAALNAAKGYLGSSTGSNSTQVEVDTQNLSMVFGFQPNKNLNFYAGPVLQTVKGNVSLRGEAYSVYNGYDANIKETTGVGWLAGAAYQIPEIALKASLTYRSEIDHDVNIKEDLSLLAFPGLTNVLTGLGVDPTKLAGLNADKKTKITTPQSVNLDFQTGIMANTVAFANVRWVNWKDFSIQPYKFGELSKVLGGAGLVPGKANGFNLVEYSDDQWSVNAGVGRKLSEQWAGNVSVGWDSGAGNPVTTLGPTEGYWNVGVGVQYSPTPATFIAGGVKYFWLGDAKAQTGAQAGSNDYVAKFEDNNALAYGLKIGYKF
ncbi:outer membrane protein transport protein [Acinetobacter sp. 102]|uniref:outer membrane protein transport protein n=1 Tax=Acinetobacter sp. 102 TaxID=3098766 RepID=UPI00300A0539